MGEEKAPKEKGNSLQMGAERNRSLSSPCDSMNFEIRYFLSGHDSDGSTEAGGQSCQFHYFKSMVGNPSFDLLPRRLASVIPRVGSVGRGEQSKLLKVIPSSRRNPRILGF